MSQHPGSRSIQTGLKALGFDPGLIDGWTGPKTLAAGRRVLFDQRELPRNREAWRAVQRGLKDLGYAPGPIDGLYGQQTRLALLRWYEANGVPASSAMVPNLPPVVQPAPKPFDTAQSLVSNGAVIRQGSAGHVVRSLMLHTSATAGTWWRNVTNQWMLEEIRRWHTDPKPKGRGWRDIGYHRVFFPDGQSLQGRPYNVIGAGAENFNAGWIHLCMIPIKTIERMGKVTDFYTAEQVNAVRAEIARLALHTPLTRIAGHNEVAAKLCPGFRVLQSDWL